MAWTVDLNANFRRAAERLVNGVLDRLSPVRRAEQQASGVGEQVLQAAKHVVKKRSASVPPPIVPGTGKSWTGTGIKEAIDPQQQQVLGSMDARRGRAFARTGPTPAAFARTDEITLEYIARLHSHVERNGWMWDKADLDMRIVREHEHLQPADRQRRAWLFSTYPRLMPRNDTRLAQLVRNAVAAIVEDIDGFDSSLSELQVANATGMGMSEICYKSRRLRVVTGPKQSLLVDSEGVSSLESIPNRSLAYDIETDQPYVNQGGWTFVDPLRTAAGEPLRKVLYHKGFGDGAARVRGYGFAAHHLHWLSKLCWEKAASLVEVYGLPTPYAQPDDTDHDVQDEDLEAINAALRDLGKGIPTVLSKRAGELKTTPQPTAITPLHQAWIGYCNTGLSKLVTGQTLAMEVGSVGSYNASETHADSMEGVQRIDARLTANACNAQLLRFLCEINAVAWARAFAPYCPGEECSPQAIIECVPRIIWDVSRKLTKTERLKMFCDASGILPLSRAQMYEEFDFRPPMNDADELKPAASAPAAPEQPAPEQPAPLPAAA